MIILDLTYTFVQHSVCNDPLVSNKNITTCTVMYDCVMIYYYNNCYCKNHYYVILTNACIACYVMHVHVIRTIIFIRPVRIKNITFNPTTCLENLMHPVAQFTTTFISVYAQTHIVLIRLSQMHFKAPHTRH